VHVPRDLSGLDHDFFTYKYEGSLYTGDGGAIANSSPSAAAATWPLQGPSSAWLSNAAVCYDKLLRTGNYDYASCGDGSQLNGTTATTQSKQAVSPITSVDQGAAWKTCHNTGIIDGSGGKFYLGLITDAEWMKAADWGDVDYNGSIDQSVRLGNIGQSVNALESGTGDTVTIRCHSDNNPTGPYPTASAQTANCQSRFGAMDMVGNMWEWTTGQVFSAVGRDNGQDGMWYGITMTTSDTVSNNLKHDLLRAFSLNTGLATLYDYGDRHWYVPGLKGISRGGRYQSTSEAGRFDFQGDTDATDAGAGIGVRCSF
ncbi:MAG: hypothetical protein EOO38_20270, partial [Cytophagaceae bacterium]